MSTPPPSRIAAVQMACSPDPAQNLSRAIGFVREAAAGGARLVCLPELFLTLYFCQSEDHAWFDAAEPIPGPATQALGETARELGVEILASLFERRTRGLYHNTLTLINAQGELALRYRKMHIPDDPGFYEKFYFTPGDLGFQTAPTSVGTIGTLVCWDQWYPEAARLTALQGAEVLFYPTAIGWQPSEKERIGAEQLDAWVTVQRGHAIANGVYLAAVNRIGFEPEPNGEGGIEFWGNSFIADPFGVVLARASSDREEILYADIDPTRIEDTRRAWPFLRDRRIDAYAGIQQRFID